MKLAIPVSSSDHLSGGERAAITLVEYGDFECELCGRAYPVVKNMRRHYGDKLRFVFRNFPLTQQHPRAQVAAEVAEAAAAQGKFWEMHDMLFEHQSALELTNLLEYASHLKLDVKRIASELETKAYVARVKEDVDGAVRSGVDGTPGFFVNGERFTGDWSGTELIAALERTLAK